MENNKDQKMFVGWLHSNYRSVHHFTDAFKIQDFSYLPYRKEVEVFQQAREWKGTAKQTEECKTIKHVDG